MLSRSGVRHNLVILAVLVIAALPAYLNLAKKQGETIRLGLSEMVPDQVDTWQKVRNDDPTDLDGVSFLNEMSQSLFYDQDKGYLQVTLEYSSDSRRKYELHFPAICQAARGDEVIKYPEQILLLPPATELPVAFLSWLQKSKNRGAVTLYWYVVGDKTFSSTWSLKLKQAFAGLFNRPEQSVMVRIDAFYQEGLTEAGKAEKRRELKLFATALYNELEQRPRRLLYGS